MNAHGILKIRKSPLYGVISFISSFLVVFQSVALGFLITVKPSYADVDPVINEVVIYPLDAQWIEIYNPNSASFDISGWKLNNSPSSVGVTVLTFTSGTTILGEDYLVVEKGSGSNEFSFNLDHYTHDITLFRPDGTEVTDFNYPETPGDNESWVRIPNGSGSITNSSATTKGYSNDPVVDTTPPSFPGNPGWGQSIPPSGYAGDGNGITAFKSCGSYVLNDGSYRGLWAEASDPSGVLKYQRQVFKNGSLLWQGDESTNYTGEFVPGVSGGAEDGMFYVRVRALDTLGNATILDADWADMSTYLSWCKLTIDTVNPTVPSTPVVTTSVTDSTPTWSWTASSDLNFDKYVIYWDIVSGGESNEADTDSVANYTHTSALADGTWYVKIVAYDKAGNFSESSVGNVTIDVTLPTKPTGLKFQSPDRAIDYSCGSATPLQTLIPDWNDNDIVDDPSFSHYEYTSFNPGGSIGLNENVFYTSEFVNTWVPTIEGTYGYAVRSVDNVGNKSDWSLTGKSLDGSCKITYDSTPPSSDPSGFSSSHDSGSSKDTTITVNWSNSGIDAISGVDGYSYNFTEGAIGTPNATKILEETDFSATSEPLTDGTWYFNIRTVDNAGNWTATAHYGPFAIDTTPPASPSPISPMDGYATKGVAFPQIWSSVADAVQYEYQSCSTNPGDTGDICPTPIYTTFVSGTTRTVSAQANIHFWWRVRAKDSAGNWSPFGESYEVIIDNSAPTILLNSYSPDPTNNNIPTYTGTSADVYDAGVEKVEYRIVDNLATEVVPWTLATGDVSFSFIPVALVDGVYTFYARATDGAGNVSSTVSDTLTIDTTAPTDPTWFSTTPLENGWTNGTVQITWHPTSAVDGAKDTLSGVYGYSYSLDQDETTVPDDLVDATETGFPQGTFFIVPDGEYYFHLRTVDNAGNWTSTVHLGPLGVDKTPPSTFALPTPTDGAKINDATPILDWENSNDAGSGLAGYEVYLDGSKVSGVSLITPSAFSFISDLSDGTYNWYIKAFDKVGWSTQSPTWSFTIDTVKPTSAITTPTNSGNDAIVYTNSWDGIIFGTATDNTSGVGLSKVELSIQRDSDKYYWNGASWQISTVELLLQSTTADSFADWIYTLLDPAFDETYFIKSHATDLAGNYETTYKITVVYDKTIPEVVLTIDPTNPDGDNNWYITQPSITLTGTDANFNKREYQLNSITGEWMEYTIPVTVNEGTTKFYYRASDLAGNVSEVGLKNVKVDLTNPEDPEDFRTEAFDSLVTLEWGKSPSDDIDHYTIYRSENKNFIPNPESQLKEVSSSTRNYDDEDVGNDTKYHYYLIAFDEAGRNSDAVGAYATPATTEEEAEAGPLPGLVVPQGQVEGINTEETGGALPTERLISGEEKTGGMGEVKGTETEGEQQNNTTTTNDTTQGFSLLKYWWLFLLLGSGILGVYLYKKSD